MDFTAKFCICIHILIIVFGIVAAIFVPILLNNELQGLKKVRILLQVCNVTVTQTSV